MSESQVRAGRKRSVYRTAVGVALLVSGGVLLFSILAFKAEKPVDWPPLTRGFYIAAYGVMGTAFIALLWGLVYLTVLLIAAFAGRSSWRQLGHTLLAAVLAVSIVAVSMAVALEAFYWPWAVASAVGTIRSKPGTKELRQCADLLASRWSVEIEEGLRFGLEGKPPEVQVAVAYAFAASGEKEALQRLVAAAEELPDDEAAMTREDVLELLQHLTGREYGSLEDFKQQAGKDLSNLSWNPQTQRYAPAEPPVAE